MIKYALRKNQLAINGEPGFVAHVRCMASKTIDYLVTKIEEEEEEEEEESCRSFCCLLRPYRGVRYGRNKP